MTQQVIVQGNLALAPLAAAPQLRLVFPKVVEHKGFAIVPFNNDTAKVLTNLGFLVDAPILHGYQWPGRLTPMAHQRSTAAFLTQNRRAFCLNDYGTGKTMAYLWAADYLMRIGAIRRCLIIAPLSTLIEAHGNTISQNFMGASRRTFNVVHGTAKERTRAWHEHADFYIINFDGIKNLPDERMRDDIDLIVIDEVATYRNSTTQRYKVLKKYILPEHWIWGLTGLPTPREPTDAWAQAKLVNPSKVNERWPSFRLFRFATMEQVSMYKWIPKKFSEHTVAEVLSPAIRFKRDDCIDLPPTTYTTIDVEMSDEQKRAYVKMGKDLQIAAKKGTITALNEGVVRIKLLQIATGCVYNDDKEVETFDVSARINALLELLEEQQYKTIVFVPFRSNVDFLKDALKDFSVAAVTGSTSLKDRTEIFRRFQQDKDPRVLLAHPVCMSHGLTLTEASTIVWFAPFDDNEIYSQANGRITRAGQRNATTIVHIAGSAAEREIYRRNRTKESMSGLVLDLFVKK